MECILVDSPEQRPSPSWMYAGEYAEIGHDRQYDRRATGPAGAPAVPGKIAGNGR